MLSSIKSTGGSLGALLGTSSPTNKISKNNIPENLKIKIPKKFLIPEKKVENNLEINFEENINKYEKILNI